MFGAINITHNIAHNITHNITHKITHGTTYSNAVHNRSNMSYVHPEVLVSTDWVLENHRAANVRLLEVNEDILLYEQGHIPGALKVDWGLNLQRQDIRDFIDAKGFEALAASLGIDNDTTVVFYGDKSNWWAAYALWFFKYNGHTNVKLMNGGRAKWVAEAKPLTSEVETPAATQYTVGYRDASIRAFQVDVLKHLLDVGSGRGALVDVRSPDEYSGKTTHMPNYPQEGALRGGHIPGAQSIPWAQTVNEDGTFKSYDELKALYDGKGVTKDKDIIAYCRIAERSSHSWFVLKYLLGYENVRNYDGSWTEWGNLVGAPIEKNV
jgi:thiosulfate/3-mercaptopyruvate sulfurtransferase